MVVLPKPYKCEAIYLTQVIITHIEGNMLHLSCRHITEKILNTRRNGFPAMNGKIHSAERQFLEEISQRKSFCYECCCWANRFSCPGMVQISGLLLHSCVSHRWQPWKLVKCGNATVICLIMPTVITDWFTIVQQFDHIDEFRFGRDLRYISMNVDVCCGSILANAFITCFQCRSFCEIWLRITGEMEREFVLLCSTRVKDIVSNCF